jgi:hypothetical protein
VIRRFLYRIKHRLTRHVVWELSQILTQKSDELLREVESLSQSLAHSNQRVLESLQTGSEATIASQCGFARELGGWLDAKLAEIERSLGRVQAQIQLGEEHLMLLKTQIGSSTDTLNLIARGQHDVQRIKCLLLINYMQAWDSLADIYQLMREDRAFDVIVATVNGRHSEKLAHEALDAIGVVHLRLNRESAETLRIIKAIGPQIIFRQHPWDSELPDGLRADSLSFAKLCYVPYYGLQVIKKFGDEDPSVNLHTDQDFHRACWRIFCEHEAVKDTYRSTAVLAGSNVVVTGHPKLTRLHNLRHVPAAWPIAHTNRGKRAFRLIWAPHHSVGRDWMCFGAFGLMMTDMLQWAQSNPEVDIVLRPHPSLFGFMREGQLCVTVTPDEFDAFYEAWQLLPNTFIDERAEYASMFAASDAMVTDGISFLTEYQMFEKPLVFFERPDHAPFNQLGELVATGCIRVGSFLRFAETVASLKAGSADPSAGRRKAVIKALVPRVDPAHAIVGELKRALLPEFADTRRHSVVESSTA